MKRVTFDTNILPADDLLDLARSRGFEIARVTVTDREVEGTRFHLDGLGTASETAVWGESKWDEAVWASGNSSLDDVLEIISNGSFPQSRDCLSDGQRRQLRDAMIFDTHVREGRDIFVSNDSRAFIRDGRREQLEAEFNTKVLLRDEFESLLRQTAAQHVAAPDGGRDSL